MCQVNDLMEKGFGALRDMWLFPLKSSGGSLISGGVIVAGQRGSATRRLN
jgi:hypothetical protein